MLQNENDSAALDAYQAACQKLHVIQAREDSLLKAKARECWGRQKLFYHASIKFKSQRKEFQMIQDDGTYLTDPVQIGEHAVAFFQDLFSATTSTYRSDPYADTNPFFQAIPSLVDQATNEKLCSIPSTEEVLNAPSIQAFNTIEVGRRHLLSVGSEL